MTTWNPADIGTNIALSNGNLTATKTTTTNFRSGRSTTSKTSELVYMETTVNSIAIPGNFAGIGLGTSGFDKSTYIGAAGGLSVGYYGDGSVFLNDLVTVTLSSYTVGDVLGVDYNGTTGKGWFSKNGVFASGDPVAGTGAHFTFTPGTALFAAFTLEEDSPADQLTANFGATAFGTSPPSGFSAWDVADEVVPSQQPAGGWVFPPNYGRGQTDEERRKERERLGIIPREQKKLDRAAKSIAKRMESSAPDIAAEIMRAKEFDKLMSDITARNQLVMDGLALFLMQAIQARILEELRDEDDAIAMLLLEM